MIEALSFAYYILMLAIGLKIIHAFYTHLKKKKTDGAEGGGNKSISLFGDINHSPDSGVKKGRNKT
jgi:hypothetical protein